MKSRLLRWISWLGTAAVVSLAIGYALREQPLPVETAVIDRAPMEVAISAEGRTRVQDRFVVSSPIEGRLGRMEVKQGHPIKKGTILTWIMPAPLEIRSERQREAALQAAEAELASAEARVAQARVNVDQAARELRRISALVESGIRPAQDLDALQSNEAAAQQELRAMTAIAAAESFHVEEIRSSLLKSSGQQAVAVRSPVNGVVLRVNQESERIVSAGSPLLEIGDPARLELVFEILSTDAVKVLPGADVVVRNWGEERRLPARVKLIEPGAFTKVSALGVEEQRVNVIAQFCEETPSLGDGYRVEGDLVIWRSQSSLQVPVSSLFRQSGEWNVFVVENEKAISRAIKIGQRNPQFAEVLEGLSKGDVVILYPDDRLAYGAQVTVR